MNAIDEARNLEELEDELGALRCGELPYDLDRVRRLKEMIMTKKTGSKTKTTKTERTTEETVAAIAERLESEAAKPAKKERAKAVRPTTMYEILKTGFPTKNEDGEFRGQQRMVIDSLNRLAIDCPELVNVPMSDQALAAEIAADMTAHGIDYKVKNGDVVGSVGFHLRGLAGGIYAEWLRLFKATRMEDGGWVEYVGKEKTE